MKLWKTEIYFVCTVTDGKNFEAKEQETEDTPGRIKLLNIRETISLFNTFYQIVAVHICNYLNFSKAVQFQVPGILLQSRGFRGFVINFSREVFAVNGQRNGLFTKDGIYHWKVQFTGHTKQNKASVFCRAKRFAVFDVGTVSVAGRTLV